MNFLRITTLKKTCVIHIKEIATFLNLKIYQQICFSLVPEKNIYTATFLDNQELRSWSSVKENAPIFHISVDLLKKISVSKSLSGGVGGWVRLNNFLKAVRCLVLVKCFTIFHLNWNFCKLDYFSAFWYFHL